jgi:hypothetical protein
MCVSAVIRVLGGFLLAGGFLIWRLRVHRVDLISGGHLITGGYLPQREEL